MRKTINWFAVTAMFVIGALAAITLDDLFLHREPPAVIIKAVAAEETVTGSSSWVDYMLNRKEICPFTVLNTFYDEREKDGKKVLVRWPGAQTPFPGYAPKGEMEVGIGFDIPSAIHPGRVCMTQYREYGCNLLQRLFNPIPVMSPRVCFNYAPKPGLPHVDAGGMNASIPATR